MRRVGLLCAVGALLLSALSFGTSADVRETPVLSNSSSGPPSPEETTSATAATWLEPRGLNIVDLVGLVPDEYLRGSILSYTPGYGIVTYESGTRVGDTVTVRTTIFPRYVEAGDWSGSMFGCLGQPARMDQWGSVAPATTVRLYHEGEEVTSRVDLYSYVPAGRSLPVRNPRESECENQYRYWEKGQDSLLTTSLAADGALQLPANMGCELVMSYTNYDRLTAVFTAHVRQRVDVTVLDSQTFTFRSYLGPGYRGMLDKLVDQLQEKYSGRHAKFALDVPQGADYLLLNFPTTPVDPYTQFPGNPHDNIGRPSGGTYRIDGDELSVDHVNTMGLPIKGHWKDAGGSDYEYLPHFRQAKRLAAPEYFVPHGVAYDPCMLSGTCPDSLLSEIWETEMSMRVVYLRVERITDGMDQIPLRMVGPTWDRASVTASMASPGDPELSEDASGGTVPSLKDSADHRIFLPIVSRNDAPALPPDEPCNRLCGWFTEDGRMMDFVGGQ